jgi:hypothetical protein
MFSLRKYYLCFGLAIGCAVVGLGISSVKASEGTVGLLITPSGALRGEEYPQALSFALNGFDPDTQYEYTLRVRSGTHDYGSFWHPSTGRFSTSYESAGHTDLNGSLVVTSFFRTGSSALGEAMFRIRVRKSEQTSAGQPFDVGEVRIIEGLSGTLEGTLFSDLQCSEPLAGTFVRASVNFENTDYYFTSMSEDNLVGEENPLNRGFVRLKLPPSTVTELSAFTFGAQPLPKCLETTPPWRVEDGETTSFDQVLSAQKPSLILSEFMPNPAPPLSDTYDEWFELYNFGNTIASTAGVFVRDQYGSISTRALPVVNVPPGGFVVFKKQEVAISQNNDKEGLELLFGSEVIDQSPLAENVQEGRAFARSITLEWGWTTTPTEGAANVITLPIETSTPLLTVVRGDLHAIVLVGFDIIGAKTFVVREEGGAYYEARVTGTPPDLKEGDKIVIVRGAYHETSTGKITIDNPELIVKTAQAGRTSPKPFNIHAAPYELLTGEGTVTKDERGLLFETIPLQRESTFSLREGHQLRIEGFLRPYQNTLVFVLTAVEKKKDKIVVENAQKSNPILPLTFAAPQSPSSLSRVAGVTASAPLISNPRSPPIGLFPYLIFVILSGLGVYLVWRSRSV